MRFRGRAAGNIIVTVRVSGVEQVFCTGQVGRLNRVRRSDGSVAGVRRSLAVGG